MKKLWILLLIIVSSFLLISCNDKLIINGVEIEKVSIHTDLQNEFFLNENLILPENVKGNEELSRPKPVVLEWKASEALMKDGKYQVLLSKDYFSDDLKSYSTENNNLELYNLELNVVYYWKVVGSKESEIKGFRIDSIVPIRNLYVDGITNARDIGGYPVASGRTVKQGMIYRTSKFNEDESKELLITQKGINTLVNDLGVVVELDLRDANKNENGGITNSPLGDSVKYISIPMKSGGNYLTLNKNVLKDVFAVLGDEKNYPMVIHCSIGTDRTGLICFLINGLLGVSEKELYQDYLFSNFGYIYGVRIPSTIEGYLKQIKYYGKDTSEAIYNYLLAQGVDEEDIKNIIKIMKTEEVMVE